MTGDNRDEIQTCLNCKRKECTNCLSIYRVKRKPILVYQYDLKTGKEIACHTSIGAAARAIGVDYRTLLNGIQRKNGVACGYLWKRM